MKNKFIIVTDTQAIVEMHDRSMTPQKAKELSEQATKFFREGKTIILSPDFEVEDRRQLTRLQVEHRLKKLEELHDDYTYHMGGEG